MQYAYDSLNRLASAQATNNSWGQSYNYDGFGNLTDQNVIAGSAPSYHVVFNPANNRVNGDCADANGNEGACAGGPNLFDVENRLKGNAQATFAYAYAPGNKRIWKAAYSSGTMTSEEIDFWSVAGQKLAAYQLQGCTQPNCDFTGTSGYPPVLVANQSSTNYYFGGKLIKNASGYVGADRLGSIGKYYPYGQEKPSATTNGTEKFTGYLRDGETGLDYADQRYHSPGTGRFLTPDPTRLSMRKTNPSSWNRYAYVLGDPVNHRDRSGLVAQCGDYDPDEEDDGCEDDGGGGGGGGGDDGDGGVTFSTTVYGTSVSNGEDAVDYCTANPTDPLCGDIGSEDEEEPAWDPCANKSAVSFVKSHLADAQSLAKKLNVPVQFVLAVAEDESKFGSSNIAQNANNFFGLWAGAPGQTGTYTTSGGTLVAAFSGPNGFLTSGTSFVQLVQGGVSGITDPSKFFGALHDKYKYAAGTTGAKYTSDMTSIAAAALARIQNCMN